MVQVLRARASMPECFCLPVPTALSARSFVLERKLNTVQSNTCVLRLFLGNRNVASFYPLSLRPPK